jgi:uncharacterized repeat protein (TIGR01451 family)
MGCRRQCRAAIRVLFVTALLMGGIARGGVVTLTIPSTVVEGAGVLTSAGQVNLGAITGSNVVTALVSSDPAALTVPASVTVTNGNSNVLFNVTVGNNLPIGADVSVVVTATNVFATNVAMITVLSNDPAYIQFGPAPAFIDTNSSFSLALTGMNADGTVQTNFNKVVTLAAAGLQGPVPLAGTNSGVFSLGQGTANIQVLLTAPDVVVTCQNYPGQSGAFNVIPTEFWGSTQPVADIVWVPASQTLLATVPANGGVYSNSLVAIDPNSGLATNSYPLASSPGEIEISPDGTYLYIAVSNATALQRFNLTTLTAGAPFALGSNAENGTRFAYNFCVPPEYTNSVVVAARDENNLGDTVLEGIFRFDSGTMVNLTGLSASGGYWVESMSTGHEVALAPPLVEGDASTGNVIETTAGGPVPFIYRDGDFYDFQGDAYDSGTDVQLGTYPGVLDEIYDTGHNEEDPVFRRVYYLEGEFNYGVSFYNFKVYDRDLFQELFQLPMPQIPGTPTRLLRGGTNYLVYATTDNELWFIRPGATQPPEPAADVSISVATPGSPPVAGSNYVVTMTLSNAGPGLATVVQVTNLLPANTTVAQSIASTGTVSLFPSTSSFVWQVTALPAGASATLQVAMVFANGGWQTNITWALGFENDPVYTNNVATLPVNVVLPQAYGVYQVAFPSQDLLYDPVRDRLLISVSASLAGMPSNCIAVFNPYTGQEEGTTPLPSDPGRITASGDGQYLYVSLPDLGTVEGFNLPTLVSSSSFAVGGEAPYINYAGDLAAVPGQPQSVVVWQVSHPNAGSLAYGLGLGLFQNGVLAPNVTSSGVNWEIVFDTNADVLFEYTSGTLQQCTLSASGITVTNTYGGLEGGSQMAYGGGHLFASGGYMFDENPFNVDWQFAGAQSSVWATPDPSTGRVFFLLKNGNYQINGYDIASRQLLGTVVVSNAVGTPGRMIRWGVDGLAFLTSGNQLFLVRAAMVTSNNFADVAVNVAGPPSSISSGAMVKFTVTVTNQGNLPAVNVVVSNLLTGGALLSATPSAGSTLSTNSGGTVAGWTVPLLNPGAIATLACQMTATTPGVGMVQSFAASPSYDPEVTNNAAVATFMVGAAPGLDTPEIFALPANDVAWSAPLGKLLVTVSSAIPPWAGSLLTVDPVGLGVQCGAALGSSSGRVVVSADGSVAYAGTDGGVAALSLPNMAVTNLFLITENYYAFDMQVDPGTNQFLAVGAKNVNDNYSWVVGFESGVQLPVSSGFYCTTLSYLFNPAGSPLYVYNGSSFARYAVSNGLASIDATAGILPSGMVLNMAWANGRIFASSGQVINPSPPSLAATLSGIPTGSLVASDAASGRVFFLSQGTGQAVLSAYDSASLLPIRSQVWPGVSGTIQRFIRWGVDGFAAITSANQLAVVQSSLIPTNPPADVSVSFALSSPPFVQSNNITETITISNAGPNMATSVLWSNALPAGALIINAAASSGSISTGASELTGLIANLPVNSTALVTVTFEPVQSGIATMQATVDASSIDTNFFNNTVSQVIWVRGMNNSATNIVSLTLPVKDVEADPVRPLLYASIGSTGGPIANSVVVLDPVNQIISPPCFIGSSPDKLAAAPDGSSLYVALDGSASVVQLSLPSLTSNLTFAVPQSQTVLHMVVCPTNPSMVALRRSGGQLGLFVAGVELPHELTTVDTFAFLDTTGQLFGCQGYYSNVKLYLLETSAAGLAELAGQPGKQSSVNNVVSSGGLLFYNGGMVVNPTTTRVVDLLPVASGSLVAADAGCGRAFYLASGYPFTLSAFDIAQGIAVGSVQFPSLASAPLKLMRWGTNGLAFYNGSSQVEVLSGMLVPTNPPVDVVISQAFTSPTAATNSAFTVTVQVTNLGPMTVPAVVVTQTFSSSLTNVSLTPSLGTATYTNSVVTWQVGSLISNQTVTLSVMATNTHTGTLMATALASHPLNDVFWGNNAAVDLITITNSTTSNNVLQLNLPARDLVYDSFRNVIYASTPASNGLAGNLIAVIDPASGNLINAMPAGSEPDQLALSDDGQFLYASLDGEVGVQRFNLNSNLADLSFMFSTNDINFAQDLVVQPSHPHTVAASLGSYNFAAGYPSSVYLYDDGVSRSSTGGPSRGLTFDGEGALLLGYVSPNIGDGLEQMWVVTNGFLTDLQPVFSSLPGDLKYSNGRIYSVSGQVADPYAPALIGTFAGTSGPQAIDPGGGRAYYLAQTSTNWQIRAFDLLTFQSTGTQAVLNVQGTPSSLIRCGANRLAFCTTADQIFIVQSQVVATKGLAPADLGVTQQAFQESMLPGGTLQFVITVTNRGPGAASNVVLSIIPPALAASLAFQLPKGVSPASSASNLFNLGTMPAGQSLAVNLTAVITNTSIYTNLAGVSAATPDPDLSDNLSLASLQGLYYQAPDTIQTINVASEALAYDSLGGRLFAVLAPQGTNNQIAWFDPPNGLLLGRLPVDIAATGAVITDDSQFLYLTSSATNLVERVNLQSLQIDSTFTLPPSDTVQASAIIPGQPHALALEFTSGNSFIAGSGLWYAAIFDDGVPRTNQVNRYYKLIAAASDDSMLYGYDNGATGYPDVYSMTLSSTGLQPYLASVANPGVNMMQFAQGLLLFADGEVFDPASLTPQAGFATPRGGAGLAAVPSADAAAFLNSPGGSYQLTIFAISTRQQMEQLSLPSTSSSLSSLAWCGADKFAYRDASQIFLVRASVLPTADISVQAAFSTNQVMEGETVDLQVTISNAGPAAVSAISVTNLVPAGLSILSASLTNGTVSTNEQIVTGSITSLNAAGSTVLNILLAANTGVLGWMTNAVAASASSLPDPFPFNNQASQSLLVTPLIMPGVTFGYDQTMATNVLQFTMQGGWDSSFALETSGDLNHWTNILTFLGSQGSQTVEAPFDPAAPAAFYRLRFDTIQPSPP